MWVLGDGNLIPLGGMTRPGQYNEEDVPIYNRAHKPRYVAAAKARGM